MKVLRMLVRQSNSQQAVWVFAAGEGIQNLQACIKESSMQFTMQGHRAAKGKRTAQHAGVLTCQLQMPRKVAQKQGNREKTELRERNGRHGCHYCCPESQEPREGKAAPSGQVSARNKANSRPAACHEEGEEEKQEEGERDVCTVEGGRHNHP